jgi:hypothetical protein
MCDVLFLILDGGLFVNFGASFNKSGEGLPGFTILELAPIWDNFYNSLTHKVFYLTYSIIAKHDKTSKNRSQSEEPW